MSTVNKGVFGVFVFWGLFWLNEAALAGEGVEMRSKFQLAFLCFLIGAIFIGIDQITAAINNRSEEKDTEE